MDALKREKMKMIFRWVFHGNDRAQKKELNLRYFKNVSFQHKIESTPAN